MGRGKFAAAVVVVVLMAVVSLVGLFALLYRV